MLEFDVVAVGLLFCLSFRSSLSTVILQLKSMGIDNVLQFDFMSPPSASSMVRALEQLFALGMD